MAEKQEKKLITKGRYELKFRGTSCLNCGHIIHLEDKYCPNCGQANSTKRLVLKDFFDEFFSSLINYDSKLLKTLYTMLLKPGTITRDYINGKRISYTNPFRFLLSLAFLYFLLVAYGDTFSRLDELDLDNKIQNSTAAFDLDGLEEDPNDSLGKPNVIREVFKELDSVTANAKEDENLFALDTLRNFLSETIEQERLLDSMRRADPKTYYAKIEGDTDSNQFMEKMEFFWELIRADSIKTFKEANEKYGVQSTLSNRMAFNGSKSANRVISQPGTWINDTIAKLPFVIFFFLPLFAIFIYMAYIRKKYTYTDHLIFSFHNQSLLFILLILSWIIDFILDWATAGLFLMIFSIYLFQAMRKFYGQGIFKTIVKYLFLNSVFAFLAIITLILLFAGSGFTY